jgi:TRAP transporter TAXI family solute receptor
MRIGTAEPESTFLSQGQALKRLLGDRGLSVEVVTSLSASIENAQKLDKGEIDLGFMAANWIGRALRGEPPFNKPIALRMVGPMNAGPMFFITRADSSVKSMHDLRGKRIAVGAEKSGIVQHAHSILGALGLSFNEFTPVYTDFAGGAAMLKAGEVDAQLQCPIPNKVMTELDGSTDLRVIPFTERELDTVLAAHPIYRTTRMRKGSLRALKEDSVQPAVVNVLVTHERAPNDEIATAAYAISTGTGELGAANPLFVDTWELYEAIKAKGESQAIFEGVPLHPGAIEGYKKAGYLPR